MGRRKNRKKFRVCLLLMLAILLVSATALAARELPSNIKIPSDGTLIRVTPTPDPCASGHNMVVQSSTLPTCTSSGKAVAKCSCCGVTDTQTMKATGHIEVVLDDSKCVESISWNAYTE